MSVLSTEECYRRSVCHVRLHLWPGGQGGCYLYSSLSLIPPKMMSKMWHSDILSIDTEWYQWQLIGQVRGASHNALFYNSQDYSVKEGISHLLNISGTFSPYLCYPRSLNVSCTLFFTNCIGVVFSRTLHLAREDNSLNRRQLRPMFCINLYTNSHIWLHSDLSDCLLLAESLIIRCSKILRDLGYWKCQYALLSFSSYKLEANATN